MVGSKEFWKDAIQQLNFTGRSNKLFINKSTRTNFILDAFEKEWMLADFAELHEFVTKPLYTARLSEGL